MNKMFLGFTHVNQKKMVCLAYDAVSMWCTMSVNFTNRVCFMKKYLSLSFIGPKYLLNL